MDKEIFDQLLSHLEENQSCSVSDVGSPRLGVGGSCLYAKITNLGDEKWCVDIMRSPRPGYYGQPLISSIITTRDRVLDDVMKGLLCEDRPISNLDIRIATK
ncbi:MAG: hypothetical protein UR28_C0008G0050 [Candidatus Peregrinibacteria bacterium GW2011_GWF2_33_10]|nr:MAG: hypothetical protein UR28_C0008G0050 [Candidatus Peregrinibacteria bacterium GW2011_GWF2_33_10]OGJ44953.1 MAG: hypothetical protein A2272_02820 [Candidatus Peregrinibacteria bacterium RIFOXYA12_FULL_33_12]OGJ45251.1 MAG: hypothetical protein A2263_06795 [Candidatus Peregrinibacteria bacterium RIFOXYA2_FULL_33_21]OGJ51175.1 MAG: hypothetical protein A2307_04880 [Candidatus Peregrinibacteria bacterium RIFOXYB2_FULL_33_20]